MIKMLGHCHQRACVRLCAAARCTTRARVLAPHRLPAHKLLCSQPPVLTTSCSLCPLYSCAPVLLHCLRGGAVGDRAYNCRRPCANRRREGQEAGGGERCCCCCLCCVAPQEGGGGSRGSAAGAGDLLVVCTHLLPVVFCYSIAVCTHLLPYSSQ